MSPHISNTVCFIGTVTIAIPLVQAKRQEVAEAPQVEDELLRAREVTKVELRRAREVEVVLRRAREVMKVELRRAREVMKVELRRARVAEGWSRHHTQPR